MRPDAAKVVAHVTILGLASWPLIPLGRLQAIGDWFMSALPDPMQGTVFYSALLHFLRSLAVERLLRCRKLEV